MLSKVNLCVVIACMIQVNHAFYLRKKSVENVTLTEEVLLVGNCGDGTGRCGGSLCCSQYGWCGNTLSYCGEGCQGSFGNYYAVPTLSPTISLAPTVAPGSCGEGVGMCDSGLCCSKFGWCGSSSNYCGLGCQTNYGSCYTVNYNETIPLSYPTSIPSFFPSFQPSAEPQSLPIPAPSIFPTVLLQVQLSPTLSPSTVDPTQYPSTSPTFSTLLPSLLLSVDPTLSPSTNPSFIPSELPSLPPTINPTDSNPTQLPTGTPFSQSSSSTSDNILSSIAGWTYYYAWPSGVFAGIGTRTLSFIETNNLIAFYDRSDPNGDFYYAKYANKYISLTATCQGNTYQFQALIADTCSGQPCNINSNSETGYLVDMEYYTVMNIFGTTDCVSGNIQFSIDLSQSPVLPNCGGMIGACGGDQCCAANNYCGYSLSYCGEGCQNTYGPCLSSVAATSPPCGEGIGSCASVGDCCSQYGYCGSTDFYCSIGCQSNYGNCY